MVHLNNTCEITIVKRTLGMFTVFDSWLFKFVFMSSSNMSSDSPVQQLDYPVKSICLCVCITQIPFLILQKKLKLSWSITVDWVVGLYVQQINTCSFKLTRSLLNSIQAIPFWCFSTTCMYFCNEFLKYTLIPQLYLPLCTFLDSFPIKCSHTKFVISKV